MVPLDVPPSASCCGVTGCCGGATGRTAGHTAVPDTDGAADHTAADRAAAQAADRTAADRAAAQAAGRTAADKAAAQAALLNATSVIDKAATKGVYHKNNASRKVSRLAKAVAAMA